MATILIEIFGISNVKADSTTTYDARHPYLLWYDSDKQALNNLNGLDNQILWNRYFNIPLRVANYCKEFPDRVSATECSSTYNSLFIGMHGLNNGSLTESNTYSRYSANIDDVYMSWRNGSNNFTYYGSLPGYTSRINYGYIDSDLSSYSQAHKQNVYYSIDTHNNYSIRYSVNTQVSLDNVPLTSSNVYSPPFSQGNVIAYKMSYMLGPEHGSYGDGSWSNTSHYYNTGAYTSPTNEAQIYMVNSYGSYINDAYSSLRNSALFWLNDSSNYDYINMNIKKWYRQNNAFGVMFDGAVYNPSTGDNYSGCNADICSYGPQYFQGSHPMLQFLDLYGHTYYDKNTNTSYSQKFTFHDDAYSYQWYDSPSVHGVTYLKSNNNYVATLSTSTILVAQPYSYQYDDNGTTYYSDVWFLDIWFFAYLDNIYNFNQIGFSFVFDNQLSMYPQYSQIDIISPDTSIMVIGSVNNVSAITTSFVSDLTNFIENIPIIGNIISIVLNVIVFVFSFIYNVIVLFVSLPLWIRGGFVLLFTAVIIKILDKMVRGG